ncbi:hypothetical protein [Streptomyces bohaiensis]
MPITPKRPLDIRPKPSDAPPKDGDQVYDPKRGGWYPTTTKR